MFSVSFIRFFDVAGTRCESVVWLQVYCKILGSFLKKAPKVFIFDRFYKGLRSCVYCVAKRSFTNDFLKFWEVFFLERVFFLVGNSRKSVRPRLQNTNSTTPALNT